MTEPINNHATPESIDWEASWALMKERAEEAERRIAAVEAVCNEVDTETNEPLQGWLVDAIRAALRPAAETTESEA